MEKSPKKFGVIKQSLVDYPGEVCAVIFLPGCNFHCPYCHNQNLEASVAQEGWEEEQIAAYLQEARHFLTAVCFSGGEPTLSPHLLSNMIERFRTYGLKMKVDTNGSHPQVLQSLQKQIDYLAMDLKTAFPRYPQLADANEDHTLVERLTASLQLLQQRDPHTYEFRTTLAKEWTQEADLHDLGKRLQPSSFWYLQRCRTETPLSGTERIEEEKRIQHALSIARTYSQHVFLRE